MKTYLSAVLLSSLVFGISHGARILFIYNIPLYSHYIIGKSLAEELAWRGHEVTMITGIEDNHNIPNLKTVCLDGIFESINGSLGHLSLKDVLTMPTPAIYIHKSKYGYLANNFTFAHKNFQQHLKETHKYDLIIMDYFFTDSLKILCHYYNTQCVLISSTGSVPSVKYLSGNPASPSLEPEMFAYSDKITLLQRVKNVCFHAVMSLTRSLYFIPKHQKLIDMHFPNAPDIYQLFSNTSLTFLNSHFGVSQPGVRVPNLLDISGIHITLKNEIPADIQSFLDGADNGVIYFSLGSDLRSADLPVEIRKCLLKAFGNLRQRVLWKFEEAEVEGLPSNVMVSKWMPQINVLAHGNIKVFITHGGLLSLTEAIYFSVPVIGIPFGADEDIYLSEMERLGLGIKIDFRDLTDVSLLDEIAKILADKRFTANMKIRSDMFKDRPLSIRDTTVYWIEYVMRYKDVLLESTSAKLIMYQYYMVDDLLVILASMIVVICLSFVLVNGLFKIFLTKKTIKID